jgi:hypothetical protein
VSEVAQVSKAAEAPDVVHTAIKKIIEPLAQHLDLFVLFGILTRPFAGI